MFHRGLWTHERFMDVCILVHKVQYRDEKRTKIRFSWRVRRFDGSLFDPVLPKQTLTIWKQDYNAWKRTNDIMQ